MREINIIVAVDEAGGFGKDGKIPWNYPEDLQHFQQVTNGSVCIMGRKTYEDIREMRKGKDITNILPNRESWVVSNTLKSVEGANVARTMREALDKCDQNKSVFVIGGYRMFVQALSLSQKVYMTIVEGDYECDRSFPIATINKWFVIDGAMMSDNKKLKFVVYKRR